jgi:hypothetical protein
MKISKKDLRRIILENLSEEKLLKEANLRKIRKSFIDSKKNPGNSELLDTLAKYSEDMRVAKDARTGPFRKGENNSRYDEANVLLTRIEDYLGGKEETEAPPISDETGVAVVPEVPAPQAGGDNKEWKKYTDKGNWEYKIQGDTPNQIWVTKKVGQEKEYRLDKPKFRNTVLKLDGTKDPDVAKKAGLSKRTSESIKNCPALKVVPKPKPKPKAKAPEKKKPEAKKSIPEGTFFNFNAVKYRYGKVSGQKKYWKSKGYNIDFLTASENNDMYSLVAASGPGLSIFTESGFNVNTTNKNGAVAPGSATTPAFKKFYESVLEKNKQVAEPEEVQQQSESLSHGSLIRKRYWGRY